MRRTILALALATACTTVPPPPPLAPPPPVRPSAEAQPYGLTLEEEAAVLRLEDRRAGHKAGAPARGPHLKPPPPAPVGLGPGRVRAAACYGTTSHPAKGGR